MRGRGRRLAQAVQGSPAEARGERAIHLPNVTTLSIHHEKENDNRAGA